MVMRRRQKERPNDPKTLACSSLMEYLNIDTSFKVADISMEDGNGNIKARDILFATSNQLALLRKVETCLG